MPQSYFLKCLHLYFKSFFPGICRAKRSSTSIQVGSPQGGVDIEEVAEKNPELIFKVRLSTTVTHKLRHVALIMSLHLISA
jgi:succinyl-CoA synthetase beta subunit